MAGLDEESDDDAPHATVLSPSAKRKCTERHLATHGSPDRYVFVQLEYADLDAVFQ